MTRLLGTWRVAVLWLAVMGSLLLAGSASGATSVHAASFYEYAPAASTTITAQHHSVVLISRASPRTVPRSSTTSLAPSLATKEVRAIPKPPTGRGSVPEAARDPRRLFSRSEVQEGLAEQGGLCAVCRDPIDDLADATGHHVERHADGGRTGDDNLAVLCPDCHAEIHRPR